MRGGSRRPPPRLPARERQLSHGTPAGRRDGAIGRLLGRGSKRPAIVQLVKRNATMPHTNWKTMRQYTICLASKQVVHACQGMVRRLLDLVGANIRNSCNRVQTRDLLLPKLMSGEFRLPDVKRVVTAVA